MKDFSIELAAEQISDQRTKEYFNEVLSSYINGNFRSAVVMLWSVVVSDFVYKLQSLRDLYQDQTAILILDAIDTKQQSNPSSPDWESFLLEEINLRTHLLEPADYQHLINLLKLRHLSAHPVLSGGNLLFSPNKETTRSLIRNALEAVLLKPPIFSKKIVEEFVMDIAAKKEFLPDKNALNKYLSAKYFGNLHISVEHELIKALWKFCFRLSNVNTDLNRDINIRALQLFYQRNPTGFRQFILQHADYFSEVAPNGDPLNALIKFLSENPALFTALTDTARVPMTAFAQSNINLLAPASFLSPDFSNHINRLNNLPNEQLRELNDDNWSILIANGVEVNCIQEVYGLGIKIYSNSLGFNPADSSFARFIEPYVNEYDSTRILQILNGIEANNQTYWRGRSRVDHPLIAQRALQLGDFDLAIFPHFCSSLPENQ